MSVPILFRKNFLCAQLVLALMTSRHQAKTCRALHYKTLSKHSCEWRVWLFILLCYVSQQDGAPKDWI